MLLKLDTQELLTAKNLVLEIQSFVRLDSFHCTQHLWNILTDDYWHQRSILSGCPRPGCL